MDVAKAVLVNVDVLVVTVFVTLTFIVVTGSVSVVFVSVLAVFVEVDVVVNSILVVFQIDEVGASTKVVVLGLAVTYTVVVLSANSKHEQAVDNAALLYEEVKARPLGSCRLKNGVHRFAIKAVEADVAKTPTVVVVEVDINLVVVCIFITVVRTLNSLVVVLVNVIAESVGT